MSQDAFSLLGQEYVARTSLETEKKHYLGIIAELREQLARLERDFDEWRENDRQAIETLESEMNVSRDLFRTQAKANQELYAQIQARDALIGIVVGAAREMGVPLMDTAETVSQFVALARQEITVVPAPSGISRTLEESDEKENVQND